VTTIDQSVNLVNTGVISTSTTVDTSDSEEVSSTSNTETVTAVENNDDSNNVADSTQASISSRAQKLQKLAEEFFPGGPKTLKITPEFVQRLSDYEFLSQEQLDQLPASIKSLDSENEDSIAKLITNTESILEKLESEPEFEGLFGSLQSGVEQMEQFQIGGSQSFIISSKLLANEISSQLEAMDTGKLTEQDIKTIDQMVLALNLTDKLSSGQSSAASNSVINNYL
jgi:hypothetical protein